MDATSYIRSSVDQQALTFDVYDEAEDTNGLYDGGLSTVGTVELALFAPSSSAQTVVEGTGEETSFTGLVVPSTDGNGDIVHNVTVGQQIRPQSDSSKRYEVKVKEGHPNDIDPDVWRLGLDKANSSQ